MNKTMKQKLLCWLLVCAVHSLVLVTDVKAQFVRLEKYPEIPVEFEAAFVDQVSGYVTGVVKSLYGQYFGQMTPKGNVYGYGYYITDSFQVNNNNCSFYTIKCKNSYNVYCLKRLCH